MAYRATGGPGYDAYLNLVPGATLSGRPSEYNLGLALSAGESLAVVGAPGNQTALGRVYVYRSRPRRSRAPQA